MYSVGMRRAYFAFLHLCAAGFFLLAGGAARDYRREILDADKAFDAAVADAGVEGGLAWAGYFAGDGGMNGVPPVRGREKVREAMTPFFAKPGNTLRWQPDFAEVSRGGDLGYTLGSSRRAWTGPDGKRYTNEGRYITIWKRQKDGAWKIAFDGGTSTPPKSAGAP